MNPPYDGSLHLKCLKQALNFKKEGGILINLSPCGWLEDLSYLYKGIGTTRQRFSELAERISDLKIISAARANELFGIYQGNDLGIYLFNNKDKWQEPQFKYKAILDKIVNYGKYVLDFSDKNEIDGWRVELKGMLSGQDLRRQDSYAKMKGVSFVTDKLPTLNGYDVNGKYWTETRAKGGAQGQQRHGLDAKYACSIKFNSKEEAYNFKESMRCNFIWRLISLVGNKFVPYMEDYSHIWTDEDYCKFFNLTKEESEFMCREVEDYRIKDYIKYEEISD